MRKYILLVILYLSILSFCHAQYNLVGAATEEGSPDCFVLTQNLYDISGAVWYNQYVNISNGFDIYAKVYLGNENDGADGIAFVLQQVSSDVGSVGGGIGYEGIVPSVILELDTYKNEWDPQYDHIALLANGQTAHQGINSLADPQPIKPAVGGVIPDMEDGQYHDLRVTWDAQTNQFRAYIDCELRISYNGNIITNVFNGNPFVFWGFTSATGGRRNEHRVCLEYVSFTQNLQDTTLCRGESTQLDASTGTGVTYSWFPAAGLSNPNIANPIASPDVTTTYTVTISDPCGSTRTDDVTVTVRPSLELSVANELNICENESTQLSASGGISYQWSPAIGLDNPNIANPIASPLATTTYVVTTTDDCGNIQTDSVRINVQPTLNVNAGEDFSICQSESVQINATTQYASSVQWAPTIGLSDPNVANPIAFPSTTTTYTLTASDNCGNTQTDTVRITVRPPIALNLGENATICPGESIPLNASVENGVEINWSPAIGLNDPTIANPIANPESTTTYVIAATDECGNTRQGAITVSVRPTVTVNAGEDIIVCQNEAVELAAQVAHGLTMSWTPATGMDNPNIVNPTVSVDSTTTFTITATDECGNSQSDDVTLIVRSEAQVDAGEDMEVCPNESVQLNGFIENAASINWTPAIGLSDPTIANPIVSLDTTITYTLTATDNCGYSKMDSISITVKPTVSAYAGEDITICAGESVALNALVEHADQIVWSPALSLNDPNIANPTASPEVTTIYELYASDACGSIQRDTVIVNIRPTVAVIAGNDINICKNETVQLNAQIINANSLSWSPTNGLNNPNISNPTVSLDSTTTYTVTATDACGNTQSDTLTITVRSEAEIDAGEDVAICPSESVQLNAFAGNAQNIRWASIPGLSAHDILDPIASPEVTTTYIFSATDECGNVQTDSVKVIVNPLPEVFAGEDMSICQNESFQLNANISGGNSISWSPIMGLSEGDILNPIASPQATTIYTLTSTSESGCTNSDEIIIQVNALPYAEAGEDMSICFGESINLQASGGQAYQWLPDPTMNNSSTPNPSVNPANTQTYWVEATDEFGCKNIDSVTVFVNPLPNISVGEDLRLCEGESVSLTASGGETYRWSPAVGLSDASISNPIATPSASTRYTLVGTDENGCENTAFINIQIKPLPQIQGESEYEICAGNEVSLQVSGGESYIWSTGENAPHIQVNPIQTTSYWVVPVTEGCAGDTLYTNVQVETWPELAAEISDTVGYAPLEVAFVNLSSHATSYQWSFGDGTTSEDLNPTHIYEYPGIYQVRLSGQNRLGCETVVDLGEIEVKEPPFAFPNAFTPNGDGINDAFDTRVRNVVHYNILIFNRWGHLIFASNDPTDHWDGTYQENAVPEGVYVFKLQAQRYLNGKKIDVAGTVTLIR